MTLLFIMGVMLVLAVDRAGRDGDRQAAAAGDAPLAGRARGDVVGARPS